MDFVEQMKTRAKRDIKRIVLPEGTEPRVIKAAKTIADEKVAKIVLLGKESEIKEAVSGLDISNIEIIDYLNSEKIETYAKQIYELRKEKGVTLEKAYEMAKNASYFGVMMVYNNEADGMVSGAAHSTADTLRPALQIIKTAPGSKLVSSFFIMLLKDKSFGKDGCMLYSDCGLNENPDADQLSEIAIASAATFKLLAEDEPRIAMLSYSTYGSAKSEMVDKVVKATNLVKEKAPQLVVDGELQVDAAVIPEVAEFKAKGSPIKGKANVLIFPDLNAGNIAYKITQRFGGAVAFGPVIQGLRKPVNDLSRGSTVDDIIGTIAITAVQAQNI
jgi:phosphate acetyltransferase